MIVDIMFRKCNMSNTKDIRYSNELILESLLLKIKSLSYFGILRSFTCDENPSTVYFLHLHLLQSVYSMFQLNLPWRQEITLNIKLNLHWLLLRIKFE